MDKKTINKEIGTRLQNARKALGVSQEEIAEIAGVAKTTISCTERGEQKTSVPVLLAYCEKLHKTPNELLGYNGDSPSQELISVIYSMTEEEQKKILEIAKIIRHI